MDRRYTKRFLCCFCLGMNTDLRKVGSTPVHPMAPPFAFEMIFKRSESSCLVLKPIKMNRGRVPYFVLDVSSIYLQYYLNFCFDSGTIANSCTTRLLSKSYEIPVDLNYPNLQCSRNKIYRIAKKIPKKLLAPFQMTEHAIDNDLLMKRSCKLA